MSRILDFLFWLLITVGLALGFIVTLSSWGIVDLGLRVLLN